MKKIFSLFAIATAALLVACASTSSESSASAMPTITRKAFPDNAFQEIPSNYLTSCAQKGTIEQITYKTKNHKVENAPEFEKRAFVYLPYGYDANDTSKKYNILYLMHGGGGRESDFLAGRSPQVQNLIDNMIAAKIIPPMIICTPTYNTQYERDAARGCADFHLELKADLIPAVEAKYHTYAKNVTPAGIKASRTHRAFSGFSMGAVCTWAVFQNSLDEIAYYIPISGDSWAVRNDHAGSVKVLADAIKNGGHTAADFKIYSGCGRTDIAEPNLTPQINEMKKLPEVFVYADNFAKGNFYQMIYELSGHTTETILRVLYNGLPKSFDEK